MVWVGFVTCLLLGGYLITQGAGLIIMTIISNQFTSRRDIGDWILGCAGVAIFVAGIFICYYTVKFAPFTVSFNMGV